MKTTQVTEISNIAVSHPFPQSTKREEKKSSSQSWVPVLLSSNKKRHQQKNPEKEMVEICSSTLLKLPISQPPEISNEVSLPWRSTLLTPLSGHQIIKNPDFPSPRLSFSTRFFSHFQCITYFFHKIISIFFFILDFVCTRSEKPKAERLICIKKMTWIEIWAVVYFDFVCVQCYRAVFVVSMYKADCGFGAPSSRIYKFTIVPLVLAIPLDSKLEPIRFTILASCQDITKTVLVYIF